MRVRYAEGCFPTRRGVPLPLGERSKEVAVPVPLPQIKIILGSQNAYFCAFAGPFWVFATAL